MGVFQISSGLFELGSGWWHRYSWCSHRIFIKISVGVKVCTGNNTLFCFNFT